MKNNSYYFKTITGIALFLFAITGIQAQCPSNATQINFDWYSSPGNGNIWTTANQNTGDSQTYSYSFTNSAGDPATVEVTMTLQDPDGANGDDNLICPPEFSTGGGVGCNNYWTETDGVYGTPYLTMGVFTLNTTESFTLDFEFSYATKLDDWEIHDIDDIIRPGTYPGGGDGGGNVGKANSYQDEIVLTASYFGTDVPITLARKPGVTAADIIIDGQSARATLDYTDDNNVLYDNISPSDVRSHILATTAGLVDKFSITYKNGPDDARPAPAWPQTFDLDGDDWLVPVEDGWSDGHAIRIPGFVFCVLDELELSGNVFNDINGDANVDGAPINDPSGQQLYATLLDDAGNVVASAPIESDGTYSFSDIWPNTDYRVQLSLTDETAQAGSPPSTGPELPAGWINTGEDCCDDSGNDGNIDGYVDVSVGTTNVTEANFGIQSDVSLSGNVFHDTDGNANIDGTPIYDPRDTQLYATLLDDSGNVVASVPIEPDGTYNFDNVTPNSNYRVQLSITNETAQVGSSPSTGPELPVGWINIGEDCCDNAGNDGSVDGLVDVSVGTTDVTEANFGIDEGLDYGDAPDSYGTTLANDGPRHKIDPSLFFGTIIGEPDPDGQPTDATATGDDNDGGLPDDEDGWAPPTSLAVQPGGTFTTTIAVTAAAGNSVSSWIDWDMDGVFDPDEMATAITDGSGSVSLTFNIPADNPVFPDGVLQNLYARFRISSDPGAITTPYGEAPDGEVEDYFIEDVALPVELAYFTASTTLSGVELKWRTESEVDNLGFVLERKTADGEFVEIASYKNSDALLGQGTTSSATDYSYLDQLVEVGNTYGYRLGDVDNNGVVTYHSTREVTVEQAPLSAKVTEFTVLPAYPNPFNPSTTIRYGLSTESKVSIEIYDISGKLITTLLNSEQTPGWHAITWNGTNQHGEQVPAGLYLNRITSGNEVKTNKLMLLK